MRLVLFFAAALLATPATAETIRSEYTQLNDEVCTTFATAPEGEGDWSRLVCNGFRGFPVMVSYGDARESVFYGYPPAGDMAPGWESFGGFNSASGTIEWRIGMVEGGQTVPFATIHRWSVSTGDETSVEVLVVEKVGQPAERIGCVTGYVVATGNADANEQAREIADTVTRGFDCGTDEPVVKSDAIELPYPYRVKE